MSDFIDPSLGQTQREQTNRGLDNAINATDPKEITFGLMQIDEAIIRYLDQVIAPRVMAEGQPIKVPVIYGNPEKWKSIRVDGVYRDQNGKIQAPLIMLQRTAVRNSQASSPVNKYLTQTFEAKWNRRDVYDKFAVLNRISPSKEYTVLTKPDYVTLTYEVVAWTEYQTQMNELIEQINFEVNEYWGLSNDFKFLVRVDGYTNSIEAPTDSDRVVRSTFSLEVNGYLLPPKHVGRNFRPIATTQKSYGVKKAVLFVEAERKG